MSGNMDLLVDVVHEEYTRHRRALDRWGKNTLSLNELVKMTVGGTVPFRTNLDEPRDIALRPGSIRNMKTFRTVHRASLGCLH